jgi:hypothetical protein
LFEREDLPAAFRTKAASELFAGLSLISPIPLEAAQRTMLFAVRLWKIPDANSGLHRNLLSVYIPNLLASTASKPGIKTLLPSESDRKEAVRLVSAMSPSPERDRFLESISQ